jgi:hypothetical protein
VLDRGEARYPVTCARYVDVPQAGSTVAATLGLCLTDADVGPELLLLVESTDRAWPLALGTVAQRLMADVEGVLEGSTIDFGAEIVDGSGMSAFVLMHPLILDEGESNVVHTPTGHVVLLQAVPLFKSEMESIRSTAGDRVGAAMDLLRELGDVMYNPLRPPIR